MPLINCEMSFTLIWSVDCVITSMERRAITATQGGGSPTGTTFKITDTKLYVPVVTLSNGDDTKLLEELKTGFKRKIKWNKYRLEMTKQVKTDNLIYLLDPTFSKVIRFFVLSFENEEDRRSYSKYYASKVERGLPCIDWWQKRFFMCQ